jgi:hypothetical protein
MIRSFAELLTKREPAPLRSFLVIFEPFSELQDNYAIVNAPNENKAYSVAKSQFGRYVSAILRHTIENEKVLQRNFNKKIVEKGENDG